jgi:hypothetical protein
MFFNLRHKFFNLFFKNIQFVPYKSLNKSFSFNDNIVKSTDLHGITQFDLNYHGQSILLFFLPLVINLSEISNYISNALKTNKVLSIVASVTIINSETNSEYYRSLSDTNKKLYTVKNFSEWPKDLFSNVLKILEMYHSFTKITITIHIIHINFNL